MSREFPDLVAPCQAADGRRTFQGTMPLKRMQRLAPLLAPAEWPDARFSAAFGYDRQGMLTVDLHVEAELPLVCQRSLEIYREPVVRHSMLAVTQGVAEQDLVPEHYEPVLAEQGRLALLDLVEDELLLALPQVPRKPEAEPGAAQRSDYQEVAGGGSDGEERTHRPFEGLADLLGKRGK